VPMGYVEIGTEVAIEVRGQRVKAVVVATPFYKRAKTGVAVAAPVVTAPLS
jgi:aminomethyltransferase